MWKNTRRGSTVRNAPTSSRGLLMTITGHAHAEATLELTCIQGHYVHLSTRGRRHAEKLRGSSWRECKRTYRANECALHCTQSAASHDAHVTPVRNRSARDDFGRAALRQHNAVLDPAVLAERFELRSHLLRLQQRARPKQSVLLIGMHQHQCILLTQEIRTSPRESRERLGTIIYSEENSPPWRVCCLAPSLGSHHRKKARDPNTPLAPRPWHSPNYALPRHRCRSAHSDSGRRCATRQGTPTKYAADIAQIRGVGRPLRSVPTSPAFHRVLGPRSA